MKGDVVRHLVDWLAVTTGATDAACYVWDPAVGKVVPVSAGDGALVPAALADRLATLTDAVLRTAEPRALTTADDATLRAIAPATLRQAMLLPYWAGEDPLGVLVVFNADAGRFAAAQPTLDLVAVPTLLALRRQWEAQQATAQSEELQRHRRHLLAILSQVESRQRTIDELAEELARTKARLECVLESAADGVISLDADGCIQSVNERAAALLGADRTAVIGRRLTELVPLAVHDQIGRLLERTAGGETLTDVETLWPSPSGPRAIRITLSPFRVEDGTLRGTVSVMRDTTEQDRLRAELHQAEKLAALGEMVAGIAHELNNPLSAIMGRAEVARDTTADPEMLRSLDVIIKSAERTARIVRNLLLYAGQRAPDRRLLDVNELLDQVLVQHAEKAAEEPLAVRRELSAQPLVVDADAFQLEQVFRGIVQNAREALRGRFGATLTARTRLDASGARVVVELGDNGPGIPAEHLSRVFDPFFTTKPVGQGTGLGLSICYGIVKEHGGRIGVQNRPGGGAVIWVELPASGQRPRPATEHAEAARDLLIRRLLERRRLLVVDDEPHICGFLRDALSLLRCDVDTAATVAEGLEKFRDGTYDAVIYDYRLPDGTGEALAREIMAAQPSLAGRMLLITGDAMTPEASAWCEQVPHVLVKPFNLRALYATLRAMFQASPAPPGR